MKNVDSKNMSKQCQTNLKKIKSSNEKIISPGGTLSVKFGIYLCQMIIFRGGIK